MMPARSIRTIAILLVSWFAAVTFVSAISEHHPPGRFDNRVLHREGGAVGVAPRSLESLDASDPLRVGWEEFGNRHGGAWTIYLDERTGMPTLVSGRGIRWFDEDDPAAVDLKALEAKARQFLHENHALLGDGSANLVLDAEASAQLRRGHRNVVFRQEVDGVRVEDARLEFHVDRGRLTMFGASLWSVPRASGRPRLDADQARAILDDHLEISSSLFPQLREPELVIVSLDADPMQEGLEGWTGPRGEGLEHALIWRFRFRVPDEPQLWVGEVDAHTGVLRALYDGAHYESIRGGVFPISNDEDCADGGCEIHGFPMPFADYTESGQSEAFSNTFGHLTCGDPGAGFETNLAGPYIHVNDTCGATAEMGSCSTGADFGLKHGENCEVAPGASPGNSAAARTAYYHLNRAAELARFYDPANAWLQNPVTVKVNIPSTCNAFWNGEINMYGEGDGCGNTGEQQGVTVHEWGHGYDENDGGGFDSPSEAYADITAIFAARDSCMSRGFFNDGRTCTGYGDTCLTCTGLRDLDWAARQNNTPTTGTNFAMVYCEAAGGAGGPCQREPHCEGYLAGETIFDLATRDLPASGLDTATAWQLAERLWYASRPGSGGAAYLCIRGNTNSCGATSWYQKMRVVDDDDADLANGTPHGAALFAAFDRHGLACGDAGDPENQSTSSCPSLATPMLTVTETPSGTELSWGAVTGAAEYRVYRGDLGCDRQQIPIASLTGGETVFLDNESDPGLPRFYRIEAFGATPACHSAVSNCEATPLGARLQKNGHVVLEDGTRSNGDGSPDPGETLELPVTLFNSGIETALAVTGELRLVESTQGRVIDPEASWADIAPTQELESDDPHFRLTLLEEAVCGQTLNLELDAMAANAVTTTYPLEIQLGEPERDFLQFQPETIPPETAAPVTSTLFIDQDQTISELDVSVGISHGMVSELIVELTSPHATTVRLHDRSDIPGPGINIRYDLERDPDGPGTMSDFIGESTQGTWTLSVQDVGPLSSGNGSLQNWTLHMTVTGGFDCESWACPDPLPTEAPVLHVEKSVDGDEVDLVFTWTPAAGAAGYHLLQSPVATFDADVDLIDRTTAGTTSTLPDGANATPDLIFFQVRGVNSCNQEGP